MYFITDPLLCCVSPPILNLLLLSLFFFFNVRDAAVLLNRSTLTETYISC